MNQIIKTTVAEIGGEEQQTVNARELWKVLGSKRQFGNWIKERLSDFIEGQDFAVNKIVNGKNRGRFASMEYYITLDVAKHLAMLERNEIGKKVRQYFIEVEKEARRRMKQPTSADILRGIIDTQGIDWILERLERCEMLEVFAPLAQFGTTNPKGFVRHTFRRGSIPVRGGRKLEAVILRVKHPDLFTWGLIRKNAKGNR